MATGKESDSRLRVRAAAWLLLGSISALALAGPLRAQGNDASAGDSAADAPSPADSAIIITGTRIGGVAPVGSALTQIGQDDIVKTGLTSTADILSTIPSVLRIGSGNAYAGGQAQQGNTLNSFTYGKSPNIRGLGVGATLSLVNSHRVPYEGGNMNSFDGDNFPAQMIQRIDVVQDGGSALYGADAIAGTVNYILRKPETTLEFYAGRGSNVGQDSWYATGIGGLDWGKGTDHAGGIIVSYQHSYQNAFSASARPDLYNDDLSPYGGAPSPLFAAPGNVVVGGVYYGIPAGQNGSSLTLSQLSATPNRTNTWTRIEVIPRVVADRVSGNAEQDVTDWLHLFADGFYVRRDLSIHGPNATTSNRVTNFGALPVIPNTNPYSPCNPSHYAGGVVTGPANLLAACSTGGLQVAYNSVYVIGSPMRTAVTETWGYGGGADVSLPRDWKLSLAAYFGVSDAPSVTTQTGGSPNPIFGTFNFFCDPTQLTCADSATVAEINSRATSLINRTKYSMRDYSANLTGSLFALPGGDVKVALGYEHYRGELLNQNNFGGNNDNKRFVNSVYGEVFVPLVGKDSAIPLVDRLELNISGRYDHYSDAGSTTNPRIGVNWWLNEDIKLFGSYGTSFRAPGLADNDPFSQTGVIPGVASGSQISGAICSACQNPAYAVASIYQTIGGANRNLKPETSETYSLGVEWKPHTISGLSFSAKYWWISYEGQISAPAYDVGTVSAINRGIFDSQIIYNPAIFPDKAAANPAAFFGNFPTIKTSNANCAAAFGKNVTTQAVFDAMITCFNTGGETGGLFGAPTSPSKVLAVVNGRRINAGSTRANGFDLTANYQFSTGIGNWQLGAVAALIRDWKVAPIAGAPLSNEVNHFGYPLRFQGRARVGWDKRVGPARVFANSFVNYTNGYSMIGGQLPVGVPASYGNIASYTTVDLSVGADTGDQDSWIMRGVSLSISVQNLFDKNPPLVVNQAGLAGTAVRFDPTYASPLGRVFQVQIGKKF